MKNMLDEKDLTSSLCHKTMDEQKIYREYMLSEIKVTREMIEVARKKIRAKHN